MSKSWPTILVLLSVLLAPRPAHAQTAWHVDDDCAPPGVGTEDQPFCTIQDGVNASSDGDTVLVAPGTYTGDGNRDISLFGKAITLKSTDGPNSTVIDIEGSPTSIHRGFFLIHEEPSETLIQGFTVMNGYLIGYSHLMRMRRYGIVCGYSSMRSKRCDIGKLLNCIAIL